LLLKKATRIAWLREGQKPSAELAVFYCKVASATEDGLDQYHYSTKVWFCLGEQRALSQPLSLTHIVSETTVYGRPDFD
jgi:hypothetical protein